MTDSAEFNGIPLFERHMPEFEKDEVVVVYDGIVKIDVSNDTIVFEYTKDGKSCECTVNIPCGSYTVEKLSDVIEILWDKEPSLIIGVNEKSSIPFSVKTASWSTSAEAVRRCFMISK